MKGVQVYVETGDLTKAAQASNSAGFNRFYRLILKNL